MHFILVMSIIILSTANLLSLDYVGGSTDSSSWITLCIFAMVLSNNMIKLVLWGIVHKRYPLNVSYSLLSLYYPIIYIISVLMQETILSIQKVISIAFIVVGSMLVHKRTK